MDDSSVAGIGHNMPPLADRLAIDHKGLLDKVQALADRANAAKAIVDEKGLKTDEDVEPLIQIGKDASKLGKEIDDTRLASTKPLRNDIETINGFFNTAGTRTDRIKGAFAEKVGEYDREKRAKEARDAAERARIAQEQAAAKLDEAQNAEHSVLGDVVMNEAAVLEEAAQKAAHEAVKAGTGPTRTAAGTVSTTGRWTAEVLDADKIPLEQLRPFIKLADLEKFCRAYAVANRDSKPLAGVRIYRDTKTSFR
ncbi:hypothetical protein OIU34_02620 [Pararhizobium sp. BT-229]|uniref:hypothetical protein n=1 Tax=Pararhizobium sp. BT-229 TaxID=2986923 RepID=UPI0021F70F9D|nr:hypothetical protein [Pararhizobium sp. BT-229]MCV9960782.1 hypothetical protein [Pararhizobium sp. BT-229]